MGKNLLVEALRANDAAKGKKAKGYFENNSSLISYPTRNPIFDYHFGYSIVSPDGEITTNVGFPAGTFCMIIGKSGTAKTAFAIGAAYEVVKPFDNGFVYHFDLEQATTISRVQAITMLSNEEIDNGKYILRKEKLSLPDLKAAIMEIYNEKISNKDKYSYNTGKVDELGREIILLEPTFIIIDSLASIASPIEGKSLADLEEISSQTDRMRIVGEVSRFLTEILEILRSANITVICINHIKKKAQMGFIKEAGDLLGLTPDETIPMGLGPLYLSRLLIRFTVPASGRLKKEEDGISGFTIDAKIIKSNVSPADEVFPLVYNREKGISMVRSCVEYANRLGLRTGNKNAYKFTTDPDGTTFTLKNMEEDFRKKRILYQKMYDAIMPSLKSKVFVPHYFTEEDIITEEDIFYQ